MRADGAIVSSDGWGNSDVDYTNTVYQLGIRGIPVTGLNFSGTMAQFVVTNEYLDAIVDISKNPEGIESENVGENAVDALDARKAQINGSLMHITAIFGLTLAGLVVQDVCKNAPTKN